MPPPTRRPCLRSGGWTASRPEPLHDLGLQVRDPAPASRCDALWRDRDVRWHDVSEPLEPAATSPESFVEGRDLAAAVRRPDAGVDRPPAAGRGGTAGRRRADRRRRGPARLQPQRHLQDAARRPATTSHPSRGRGSPGEATTTEVTSMTEHRSIDSELIEALTAAATRTCPATSCFQADRRRCRIAPGPTAASTTVPGAPCCAALRVR